MSLRSVALARLAEHGPTLAVRALTEGVLTVLPAARSWASSHGTVSAFPVTLAVEAGLLGALDRSPSAVDALVAALASGLSADVTATLDRLTLHWDGSCVEASAHGPYRSSSVRLVQGDVEAAVRAYLGVQSPSTQEVSAARERLRAAP